MIGGQHTSVKCLNCGTDLEYWAVENPAALCQCSDLRYALVVGCRNCMDILRTLIDEEIYNAPQGLAECMAKDIRDWQEKKVKK